MAKLKDIKSLLQTAKHKIDLAEKAIEKNKQSSIERNLLEAIAALRIIAKLYKIKYVSSTAKKIAEKWAAKKGVIPKKKFVKTTKELYKKLATIYEEKSPRKVLMCVEEKSLKSSIPNLKGKKVLDVGCGTGRWSKLLIKKGGDVLGIDSSKDMLKVANKVEKLKTKYMDARKINLPANSFDLVFSSMMLTHLKDYKKAIEQMIKVLKPGGILIVSDLHGAAFRGRPAQVQFITKKGKILITSYPIFPADILNLAIKKKCELVKLKELKSMDFFKKTGLKPHKLPLMWHIVLRKK